MPIVAADIVFYESTGGLGGAITATPIVTATLHNLFDVVGSAESSSGDTEYRCLYVQNDHGTLTLQNAIGFINTQSVSTDTSIEFALGSSAVGGVEQTVADESTAPTGVTWTALTGSGNSQAIGDIPAGSWKAIWIKRIVGVGSSAYSNDNAIIEVSGDTAA